MNLGEILTQVDTMVPNSISAGLKVSWINQVQNQLYRQFPVGEAVEVFTTVPGQPAYVLPSDCLADGIRSLVIDDQEYPYIPLTTDDMYEDEVDHFWTTVVTGDIIIYPTPIKAVKGVLYYRPRPFQLSESDLTATPTFPVDVHELLVLGCAARVAKLTTETQPLAAVFESDFYRLLEMAVNRMTMVRRRSRTTSVRSWR